MRLPVAQALVGAAARAFRGVGSANVLVVVGRSDLGNRSRKWPRRHWGVGKKEGLHIYTRLRITGSGGTDASPSLDACTGGSPPCSRVDVVGFIVDVLGRRP